MPLDTFFNSNKESRHAQLLRVTAHHLRNKHDNVLKNNEVKKTMLWLHIWMKLMFKL